MSHFAEIDENNIVIRVIVAEQNFIDLQTGHWVQTSYNSRIRKQFAGIGYRFDPVADVFISPQPFPSWTLDANHDWQPPIQKPAGAWRWDEPSLSWAEVLP